MDASINSTSDMLMKDDIDNLTVLAALSRQESFHKASGATSLLAALRETLGLSSDQVEKLEALEPSIALEVSMWKRIFEMQSRIEAIVALCVPRGGGKLGKRNLRTPFCMTIYL